MQAKRTRTRVTKEKGDSTQMEDGAPGSALRGATPTFLFRRDAAASRKPRAPLLAAVLHHRWCREPCPKRAVRAHPASFSPVWVRCFDGRQKSAEPTARETTPSSTPVFKEESNVAKEKRLMSSCGDTGAYFGHPPRLLIYLLYSQVEKWACK
ncbi:hypothetical protein MTO96_013604 [Rhipicephalus appendiculatus]